MHFLDYVYEFVINFLKEMETNFNDEYIHLGGDEVVYGCWNQDPQIQKFMSDHGYKSYDQLMQYFMTKILNNVAQMNKKNYTMGRSIFFMSNSTCIYNYSCLERYSYIRNSSQIG